MKHSLKSILAAGLLLTTTLVFTSCDGAFDDIFGEWDKPAANTNTNTDSSTESSITYRVYTSGTAYTDETLPTSGITTESDITNTWSGDIVISADKNLDGDVTLDGDVILIIKDGAELKVNGTIKGGGAADEDYSLKIYGQSESTGKLTIDGQAQQNNIHVKSLEFHGGVLTATNASQCIEQKSAEKIDIYHGTLDLTGFNNGITANGDITIYGGSVTAKSISSVTYAGDAIQVIGNMSILGGTVKATGCNATASYKATKGITVKDANNGGTAVLTISGGTVVATGGDFYDGVVSEGQEGICVYGIVNISGTADVKANGGAGDAINGYAGGNGICATKGVNAPNAGGDMTISGGSLKAYVNDNAPAVYVEKTATISGGTVEATCGNDDCFKASIINITGGTVEVSNGTGSGTLTYAMKASTSITISGSETQVTVRGGDDNGAFNASRGIRTPNLTINGGTVNVFGGKGGTKDNNGETAIDVTTSLTINGGTLNATGGDGFSTGNGGSGIYVNATLMINKGEVTGIGGSAVSGDNFGGRGIFAEQIMFTDGTITGIGGNSCGSCNGGSGISAGKNIGDNTISGGTITATGGEGDASNSGGGGVGLYSFGVLIVSGGTIKATGANGDQSGSGIWVDTAASLQYKGGVVEAYGATGAKGIDGTLTNKSGDAVLIGTKTTADAAAWSNGENVADNTNANPAQFARCMILPKPAD